MRIGRNKGRKLQAQKKGRRKLFDAGAKVAFLEWFTGTANLSDSAKVAGVHYRTVLNHCKTDPVFREAYEAAEAQSLLRLRAWLIQAKAETEAAIRAAIERGEEEPGGDPSPANLTVEQGIKLLDMMERRLAKAKPDGAETAAAQVPAGRGGRPYTVASNQEVRDALVKALLAHGVRVRAEMAGKEPCEEPPTSNGAPSPTSSAGGPPPRPGEDL